MERNPGGPISANSTNGRLLGAHLTGALFRLLDSPYFLPACFTLFIALRALLLFLVPVEMSSDAAWYLSRALGIARGEGYSEGGYPTAYWPIGYPGFLSVLFYLFGQNELVGQVANLLMAVATFFLQLELARRIFGSETAARLGVLLLTIYPNNIAYTSFILTETYFTFLLLLGIYLCLARRGWIWVLFSGLAFGLATLTKPQIIFFPLILIIFQIVGPGGRANVRESIAKGLTIYLVILAVLVPWAVRNSQVFGELVLISTNGGATLLTGNNPGADGGLVENDPLVAQRNFSVRDQVASDRRARQLAVEWIRNNPGRFIELVPLKVWHLWAKNGEAEWTYQSGYPHYEQNWQIFRSVRWINQIFYTLLLAGALVSVALLVKNGRGVAWPWVLTGYCLMIYLTLISIVFSGQPRFHFPAMPWVIMYAAWAAVILWKKVPEGTAYGSGIQKPSAMNG
jgi:4-amino-4-deoxy-L-arabinose transferase-like glycosyltransferase